MKILPLAGVLFGLSAAAQAANVSYAGRQSLGGSDSLRYEIVTDGTLGVLDAANIVGFDIRVDIGGVVHRFADSHFQQNNGGAFSASATRLFYDFASTYDSGNGGGYAEFYSFTADGGLFCFQTNSGCAGGTGTGTVVYTLSPPTIATAAQTGKAAVANLTRTYLGGYALGGGGDAVSYSITTDGRTGVLDALDILHFDISLTVGGVTRALSDAGGQFFQNNGGALTASVNELFYDFASTFSNGFGGGGYAEFLDYGGGALVCFQTNSGCAAGTGSGIAAYVFSSPTVRATALSGLTAIGRVADGDIIDAGTVPEPASWALMIAGFGLVGVAARRRAPARAAA